MLGYYKNEEATKQTIDENGWYHSGDLGTMDGDGNVFIKAAARTCCSAPAVRTSILRKSRISSILSPSLQRAW